MTNYSRNGGDIYEAEPGLPQIDGTMFTYADDAPTTWEELTDRLDYIDRWEAMDPYTKAFATLPGPIERAGGGGLEWYHGIEEWYGPYEPARLFGTLDTVHPHPFRADGDDDPDAISPHVWQAIGRLFACLHKAGHPDAPTVAVREIGGVKKVVYSTLDDVVKLFQLVITAAKECVEEGWTTGYAGDGDLTARDEKLASLSLPDITDPKVARFLHRTFQVLPDPVARALDHLEAERDLVDHWTTVDPALLIATDNAGTEQHAGAWQITLWNRARRDHAVRRQWGKTDPFGDLVGLWWFDGDAPDAWKAIDTVTAAEIGQRCAPDFGNLDITNLLRDELRRRIIAVDDDVDAQRENLTETFNTVWRSLYLYQEAGQGPLPQWPAIRKTTYRLPLESYTLKPATPADAAKLITLLREVTTHFYLTTPVPAGRERSAGNWPALVDLILHLDDVDTTDPAQVDQCLGTALWAAPGIPGARDDHGNLYYPDIQGPDVPE